MHEQRLWNLCMRKPMMCITDLRYMHDAIDSAVALVSCYSIVMEQRDMDRWSWKHKRRSTIVLPDLSSFLTTAHLIFSRGGLFPQPAFISLCEKTDVGKPI